MTVFTIVSARCFVSRGFLRPQSFFWRNSLVDLESSVSQYLLENKQSIHQRSYKFVHWDRLSAFDYRLVRQRHPLLVITRCSLHPELVAQHDRLYRHEKTVVLFRQPVHHLVQQRFVGKL